MHLGEKHQMHFADCDGLITVILIYTKPTREKEPHLIPQFYIKTHIAYLWFGL